MDELKEMTKKLVDYHNKIIEVSNNDEPLSDELSTEIANYLSNEVPPILLNADKHQAFMCISAMCRGLPHTFLVNVLTGLVLYIFAERAGLNPGSQTEDDPDAPVDTNVLLTDRK